MNLRRSSGESGVGETKPQERAEPRGTSKDFTERTYWEALLSSELREAKPLPGAVGNKKIVKLGNSSGEGVFISEFQPEDTRGEKNRYPQEYKRERAAFLVSYYLGFHGVPPTLLTQMSEEKGAVQIFVQNNEAISYEQFAARYLAGGMQNQIDSAYAKMSLFDYIVFNSDRRRPNYLFYEKQAGETANWDIIYLDHGCAFADGLLYNNVFDFLECQLPQSTIESIKAFSSNEEKQKELRAELKELLSEKEREALFARIEYVHTLLQEQRLGKNALKVPDDTHAKYKFNPKI